MEFILCHNINIKWRKNSDQTNKQERDRNPSYKQEHVVLFTVNKDNWPTIQLIIQHHY